MAVNKKQFYQALLLSLFIIGIIVSWLAFGDRGFIYLYRMEKERQVYVERIKKLELANQKIKDEIYRLRTDSDYIESTAKKELGLVRENEIIYRFSKDDK